MKCPNCDKDLVLTKRDDIEVEYCPSCRGMWLSRQELEELEDEVFDFGDDKKGTLVFSATATSRNCPQCGKLMKRFKYRLYDLEPGSDFGVRCPLRLLGGRTSDIEKSLVDGRQTIGGHWRRLCVAGRSRSAAAGSSSSATIRMK